MHAVEFETNIKDGIILIPKKMRKNISKHARVIVLSEEENLTQNRKSSSKRKFCSAGIKTKGYKFNRDDANAR